MLTLVTTRRFEKELKKIIKKQHKDYNKFKIVFDIIINQKIFLRRYKNHKLTGNFKDCYECHIEPDWLLIYKLDLENDIVVFERTGSHSELFKK